MGGDGGSLLSICTASIVSALKISSIHPSTQTVCKNTVPTPITVSVLSSDSEVLSYQWFKNSVDSNMGGTIINGANTNTFIPPASSSSKTDYYYATVTSSEGSKNSPTAKVITTDCLCYKPGITEVSKKSLDSKMGISSLNKGKDVVGSDHWPLTRKGAWLVLESKFKGLVVNRVQFNSLGNPVGIPPSDFVEGMIVYDMTDNCLKIYTSIDEGATFAWRCINTQACPDRIGG
ncbi:hypothetical protein PFY10_19510 [Chryseobacterium daecheongense]|nr:hypothetical protein PFY10_19510 [Chryseobacterium daecheongense]